MRKMLMSLVVCCVLVASGVEANFHEGINELDNKSSTLYVGGSGEGNYSSIQSAIDDANQGDVVFVYGGVYYENLVVSKPIKLQGEGKEVTIIDGRFNSDVVYISTSGMTMCGFTVQNSGTNTDSGDSGIKLSFAEDNNITDNKITNNLLGMLIWNSSSNNKIENNSVSNCFAGVYVLLCSNNNTFYFNTIANNEAGLCVFGSDNNSIIRNILDPNDTFGIFLSYSERNTVKNNIVWSNGGIALFESNSNYLVYNYVSNSVEGGISMVSSKDNVVESNCISDNSGGGMDLALCSNISITNNTIKCNAGDGISLELGSQITIIGNSIYSNWNAGLSIFSSSSIVVKDNDILTNNIGIDMHESLSKNYIFNNFISENQIGIKLGFDKYSKNNKIYHNGFIQNDVNAVNEGLNGENNSLDDGMFGNFWDDYHEKNPDANRKWLKGVWNQPYAISEGVQDNFPLIVLHETQNIFLNYILYLWKLFF